MGGRVKERANPARSHGCAWGLFDKDGKKDELGTLNLLTPEVVLRARDEIKTGRTVALNWGLDKLEEETFERKVLQHTIIDWRKKAKHPFYSYDDEIVINTQTGEEESCLSVCQRDTSLRRC